MYFSLFQGEPWVAINQIISTKALYNPFKNTTPELQAKIEAVQNGGKDAGKLAQEVNKYVVEQAWFAPLFRVNQMYYHNVEDHRDAAGPAGRSVHLQLRTRQVTPGTSHHKTGAGPAAHFYWWAAGPGSQSMTVQWSQQ